MSILTIFSKERKETKREIKKAKEKLKYSIIAFHNVRQPDHYRRYFIKGDYWYKDEYRTFAEYDKSIHDLSIKKIRRATEAEKETYFSTINKIHALKRKLKNT